MDGTVESNSPHHDLTISVEPVDIDTNGHVNNVVYLRWVQEAAVAHWFAAVEPELANAVTWAVVRHEIDYKRPAMLGDSLIARTWIGEVTAATCERFCEILRPIDGQTLARLRWLQASVLALVARRRPEPTGLRPQNRIHSH